MNILLATCTALLTATLFCADDSFNSLSAQNQWQIKDFTQQLQNPQFCAGFNQYFALRKHLQKHAQWSIQNLLENPKTSWCGNHHNGKLDLSGLKISDVTGLHLIPNPEQVTEIDLSTNLFESIPAEAFKRFPNVREISLSENPSLVDVVGMFNGLNNLVRFSSPVKPRDKNKPYLNSASVTYLKNWLTKNPVDFDTLPTDIVAQYTVEEHPRPLEELPRLRVGTLYVLEDSDSESPREIVRLPANAKRLRTNTSRNPNRRAIN